MTFNIPYTSSPKFESLKSTYGRIGLSLGLLIILGYFGIKALGAPGCGHLFSAIDLGIHEAGHLAFGYFSCTVAVLGGTLFELGAPLVCAYLFRRQRDDFAVAVCGCWLGLAMGGVSHYMADAQKMVLPLVTAGFSEMVIHDWHYLFAQWHLTGECEFIAGLVRFFGVLVFWLSWFSGVKMLARPIWTKLTETVSKR